MRELRTSGSVGGPGGHPPGPTRLASIECSTIRKDSREAATKAASRSACESFARRLRRPARNLIVTNTGYRALRGSRFACEAIAFTPLGLRPAPFRFPPQLVKANSR